MLILKYVAVGGIIFIGGLYCSLRQLLELGFFHADPHPGNLVATDDGSLAYFDFGMMGEIPRHYRVGLIQIHVHYVNCDSLGLANDFLSLGFIPDGVDIRCFRCFTTYEHPLVMRLGHPKISRLVCPFWLYLLLFWKIVSIIYMLNHIKVAEIYKFICLHRVFRRCSFFLVI